MKIAILFSGTGSNMRALLACDGLDGIEFGLLLTNRADAAGLAFARGTGIPTMVIEHRLYADRHDHELVVENNLRYHGIELICLAGYMRVLTGQFIDRWQGKILNVHPSLLPGLPGLHTHQRALDLGVKIHGCTVHVVTERVDDGPILGQAAVPVLPSDTAEVLAARVLVQEHLIYPTVLREVCGRWAVARPSVQAVLANPV